MLKNKNNLGHAWIVFGPQGSGKSTQAEKLAAHLSCPLFEAGEQIRELTRSDTPTAKQANEAMQNGQLIPNHILKHLIINFLGTVDAHQMIVFDGFPRNLDQCQVLQELVKQYHWRVTGLFIDIDDKTAKERLANRFTVVNGEKAYRKDDTPVIVAKRLATFKLETLPIIDWLQEHHQVITIDGHPSIPEVTTAIFDQVDKLDD